MDPIPSKVISVNGVTGDAQAMVREIKVRDDQHKNLSAIFWLSGQMGKKHVETSRLGMDSMDRMDSMDSMDSMYG